MKILIAFVFSFVISPAIAQVENIDSLVSAISTAPSEDQKMDAVLEIFDKYEATDLDSTMFYSKKIYELGQKLRIPSVELLGYNEMAYVFYCVGNEPKALEICFKALRTAGTLNNKRALINIYNTLALLNYGKVKFWEYYQKALALTDKKSYREKTWILGNICGYFISTKQFDSALVYAQLQSQTVLQNKYEKLYSNSFNLLGRVYLGLNQYELALSYFRTALSYAKYNKGSWIKDVYRSLSVYYERTGNTDSCFYYSVKCMELAMNDLPFARMRPAYSMFTIYRNKGNSDSALKYLLIYTEAKDSSNNIEKNQKTQSLILEEDLKQKEIAEDKEKLAAARKHNLQYVGIAVGLIAFILIFFALSHSIVVKPRLITFFTILGLLAMFEFINLFIHPYLSRATNDSPALMLMVLIAIGALLIPLHHKLEKWVTNVMTEKNKKIRLAAAKKTIAKLEPAVAEALADKGEQTN